MNWCRYGYCKEVIWIIVAIEVSPCSVYIVSPSTIMMSAHSAFPFWYGTTSVYLWRSTLYHTTALGQEIRVVFSHWLGSMCHVVLVLALPIIWAHGLTLASVSLMSTSISVLHSGTLFIVALSLNLTNIA